MLTAVLTAGLAQGAGTGIFALDKIRGGLMGLNDIELLPMMRQEGMNAAMVVFAEMPDPLSANIRNRVTRWASACDQAGVKFMPIITLWGPVEKDYFKPQYHFLAGGVEYKNTPCPTEPAFFQRVIRNRLATLARLSKTLPIAGAIIDIEMYGAEYQGYPQDFCECDYCFGHFQASRGSAEQVEPGKRQAYLLQKGLMEDYKKFQIGQVAQMAGNAKEEVEVIAPDFAIGVLQLDKVNQHNLGMAEGFGKSGKNPVICFCEHTYMSGYSEYIPQTIKKFKDIGLNTEFVAGIWQDQIPVENLAEQYYYCAKASDGYWIYQMPTLNARDWKGLLAAPREDYWKAIEKADAELDKLAQNSGYVSEFKLRTFATPLPPVNFKSIKVKSLQYVEPGAKLDAQAEPLALDGEHKLVFVAERGDRMKFEVSYRKRGIMHSDHGQVTLLTDKGDVLSQDTATSDKNAVIDATASYTGTYVIYLNSARDILRVVAFTHPYSIDAGQWPQAQLLKPNTPLYLWKPAGADSARLKQLVNGLFDSVTVTFTGEDGSVIAQYDIVSVQTNTISLPRSDRDEIVTMRIKPRGSYWENVFVTVESGFGRYISPSKNGVVKY